MKHEITINKLVVGTFTMNKKFEQIYNQFQIDLAEEFDMFEPEEGHSVYNVELGYGGTFCAYEKIDILEICDILKSIKTFYKVKREQELINKK